MSGWGLELLRVFAALALALGVFALAVAGWRALVRLPSNAQADFRIRRRLVLSPKASVVEIEHEGRRYLLLLSAESLRPLHPSCALPKASDAEDADLRGD